MQRQLFVLDTYIQPAGTRRGAACEARRAAARPPGPARPRRGAPPTAVRLLICPLLTSQMHRIESAVLAHVMALIGLAYSSAIVLFPLQLAFLVEGMANLQGCQGELLYPPPRPPLHHPSASLVHLRTRALSRPSAQSSTTSA